MLYKEDWDKARERLLAWWQCEVLDRAVIQEIRNADQSIYHLDGPGQIPHLDILLEIPELDGIQWVPGAGNPGTGSAEWFPMYRRIQEKGKLLILQGMAKEDVEGVLG